MVRVKIEENDKELSNINNIINSYVNNSALNDITGTILNARRQW